jgi:hypothetical protein
MKLTRAIAIAIVMVATTYVLADGAVLTNKDVVAMVKAGLDSGTVVAKIRQSGTKGFDTSVDALIALKKAGVPKDIMDAMLTGGTAAPAAQAAPKSDVQLLSPNGAIDLESLQGDPSATYIGVGFLTWLNFDGQHAAARTSEPTVSIRVRSSQKPDSRMYIVRLDVNDDDRSVKMGRSRMFSATAPTSPDREWTFSFRSEQEQDGVWKLTVDKPLSKGEYGVLRGTELFDFGVD